MAGEFNPEEIKEDIKIDKYSLDYEWERQPDLYLKYADMLAIAEIERDRLKDVIEVEKAEIEKLIRKNPGEFGLKDKPTEGAIKAVLITNPDIQDCVNDYLEKAKEAKLLGAVVKSFEHRKKALEKLVDLFLAGYFSRTQIPSEAVEKEGAASIKQEQNAKLKTRRRKRNG